MNLTLLIPEISLLITAVLVILLDLVLSRKAWLTIISLVGIVVSGIFTAVLYSSTFGMTCCNMLAVDNFALFFKFLILGIAVLVILASTDYVNKFSRFHGEYHALILLSALGMMLMAATTELVSMYISLELASISLYILVSFLKDDRSTEASLKYLLLGALSSAVLLFGMALVYGFTGTTQLGEIANVIRTHTVASIVQSPALMLGIILLIAGFGFKIAAVPFQMWVPDVYEGAPTPITAFLSVASKAAGFAIILRIFSTAFHIPDLLNAQWGMIFAVLAAIGMFAGNLAAIPQKNIKRMLGYSSIAQAGYLLVGVASLGFTMSEGNDIRSTVLFFLASYALTNLGAFTGIIAIGNKIKSDQIEDYAGLFRRSPVLTLGMTLCLISLIGIPPASGFIAKFYLFGQAIEQNLLWLVIIAVINSVISAYYYLRVVKVMWLGRPSSHEKISASGALRLAMVISCIGVLILGIFPNFIMEVSQYASAIFPF